MPKPTPNTVPHLAAAKRLADAKARLGEVESARGLAGSSGFNPTVGKLKIEVARADLEMHESAQALNRSAPDLEALRAFLIGELSSARAALSVPAPIAPTPLAAATPEALTAYVEECLASRAAHAEHAARIRPIHTRLALAFNAARDAQQIIYDARKAANMPASTAVIVGYPQGAPGTVGAIDAAIASIEAQREPDHSRGQVLSHREQVLQKAEQDLADYEAAEAKAAKSRFDPPAPRERPFLHHVAGSGR